ncbi:MULTISPECIES: AEC family transporter [unclassified Saccharibacter]|uniref:AEC family transporter n=1 Tax=unclassified Saccharibacter TaxID=2648722 RepID=UPI001325AE43|nr:MULTISPECIES: AEC family transporter [unclassified Saccharibacter]MXV35105.1 permease [Saccharibacter sp. EH611]MXV57348.1 permease [Saccharibacter sp. EH70]MXV64791.1 permease [Saccharibacter sp. EH60]
MSSSLFLTILQAIIPILVTLGLGYVAAWRRDFDGNQASVLIRLVMLYALPLALFVSILSTPRAQVLSAGPLAFLILLAMVGGYLLLFGVLRGPLGRSQGEAALMAMTMTGPSVPFIGIPVLGQLFGPASAVPISIASLAMNLFQVPLTLILLSHDQQRRVAQHSLKPRTWHVTIRELSSHLLHSCREPVVWVPLLALGLVSFGITLPPFLKNSLTLLGHATGGTALFASGVVLFARQVRFSPLVGGMVTIRNILIPLGLYGLARLLHYSPVTMQESVLTMAIPSASINVILAMRYHMLEREVASVLFFGTLSALFTMASFIWLTHP